ncbi:Glutathione S-transferase, N-terminal domain [Mariprofundus aestuarium]|uniref:Glutathione S-transferase, N-terminal domain n=1 Tax=Mariprofundus aestuarium TaxID=1921086 RepID=A0A2K8L153_MARES|nr:glutaredoxin [Mariprofundus aestuarium]ATX79541.1 Glutathione S-transferase, N-terminal domain [Mariprofundus aestuarium]
MIKAVLLKIFREGVGGLMAFVSFLTSPRKIKRTPETQLLADKKVESMSLYQYFACPFCIKTRRAVHRLNIPMEYRDAQHRDSEHRNTLEQEGGQIKVPCLRIDHGDETTWLYESNDIIAYLNQQFDPSLEAALQQS